MSTKSPCGVSPLVSKPFIPLRPEALKRRNQTYEDGARLADAPQLHERFDRIRQMFEHIEHGDRGWRRAKMDARKRARIRDHRLKSRLPDQIDGSGIRVEADHAVAATQPRGFSELQESAGPAAEVEEAIWKRNGAGVREQSVHEAIPRAKPPVVGVPTGEFVRVFRLHATPELRRTMPR